MVHLRKKCQQRGLKRSSDSIVRKQVVCQIKCVACNIMGVHLHSFSTRHIFSIFGKFWFCGVMEVSRTLYRLLGTDRWTCRFWGRQLGQIKNRLLFFFGTTNFRNKSSCSKAGFCSHCWKAPAKIFRSRGDSLKCRNRQRGERDLGNTKLTERC